MGAESSITAGHPEGWAPHKEAVMRGHCVIVMIIALLSGVTVMAQDVDGVQFFPVVARTTAWASTMGY